MTDIIRLQKEDIDIASLLREVRTKDDGAQIVFVGTVRDDGMGSLEIEADIPVAERYFSEIAQEVENKFHVRSAHIIHRYGKIEIGDTIIVTVVCAAHRKEAYQASELIIERIKEYVPIWKQEINKDGSKGKWIEYI